MMFRILGIQYFHINNQSVYYHMIVFGNLQLNLKQELLHYKFIFERFIQLKWHQGSLNNHEMIINKVFACLLHRK